MHDRAADNRIAHQYDRQVGFQEASPVVDISGVVEHQSDQCVEASIGSIVSLHYLEIVALFEVEIQVDYDEQIADHYRTGCVV